jgi:signal transduction histidine kinase
MNWRRYITDISLRQRMRNTESNPWDFQSSTLGAIAEVAFLKNGSRSQVEIPTLNSRDSLAVVQRIGQIGSWEFDLVSGLLNLSDEAHRILEISQDLFGLTHEGVLHTIHPEDCESVNKAFVKSLESMTPFCIDHRLLFPDGRIKYVRVSCETSYDEEGNPLQSHGTVQDISALKLSEQQLENIQGKLREFVINRELLRENERKQIAWKMHEELGQLLTSVKMRFEALSNQLPENNSSLHDENQNLTELIDQSISTVREIVSDLRPAVLLFGPVAALEWLVETYNKQIGMKCELILEEDDGSFISDELTTLVFRIAQESLQNVEQHNGVNKVIISWMSSRNGHCLIVKHDGENSEADLYGEGSLIFFGMQELVSGFGGQMKVVHSKETGTEIEVRFL